MLQYINLYTYTYLYTFIYIHNTVLFIFLLPSNKSEDGSENNYLWKETVEQNVGNIMACGNAALLTFIMQVVSLYSCSHKTDYQI